MKIVLAHLARGMDATPVSPMVDHLGLENIAAVLQTGGHKVALIDSGPLGLEDDKVFDALCEEDPELIGFSLNYVNVKDTLALLTKARRKLPDTKFVAGGHYATFHAEILLKGEAFFDAVVLGEGELPMVALTHSIRSHWKQVPGLAMIDGGKVIRTPLPSPPELNELPVADRRILKHMMHIPRSCIRVAVEGSRGCLHSCTFCSIAACQALAGNSGCRRVRSPQLIINEIQQIVQETNLKDFWFMDADFLGNSKDKSRILDFAEQLKGLGHDLNIEIDARADSVDYETIRALHSAGLQRCFLGIESFDQTTLNTFSKGSTVQGNIRALEILFNEGVRPIIGCIMFHPKSTIEQIAKEHKQLSMIGYEKTQMLFRLKKYRGSRDASQSFDCEGRGVSPYEDYGWEIEDSKVRLVWELFDQARLQLMDAVFIDLTSQFRNGLLDAETFKLLSDQIFNGLGVCMDYALEFAIKGDIADTYIAKRDISMLVAEIIKPRTNFL